MASPLFTGMVRDGRIHADDKAGLIRHLATLEGQVVTFTVDDTRSLAAHNYLMGPVYNAMLDYMGDTSEGAKYALHEDMKRRFLTRHVVRIINF
jgi:hypothetical protein